MDMTKDEIESKIKDKNLKMADMPSFIFNLLIHNYNDDDYSEGHSIGFEEARKRYGFDVDMGIVKIDFALQHLKEMSDKEIFLSDKIRELEIERCRYI